VPIQKTVENLRRGLGVDSDVHPSSLRPTFIDQQNDVLVSWESI
jgi:hypothetical protein